MRSSQKKNILSAEPLTRQSLYSCFSNAVSKVTCELPLDTCPDNQLVTLYLFFFVFLLPYLALTLVLPLDGVARN